MFNFESLNMRRTVKEGIDTNQLEFKALKEFCGDVLLCQGFFFTDGKYGEQVVVVAVSAETGEFFLVNMPKRSVEQFKQIADNPEAVAAVLDDKLILTDIKMADTKNGTTTIYTLKNA